MKLIEHNMTQPLSKREKEIIETALDHASLMGLGFLETNLFVSFVERVFWSGKVEGMDVALRMVQKGPEEEESSSPGKN